MLANMQTNPVKQTNKHAQLPVTIHLYSVPLTGDAVKIESVHRNAVECSLSYIYTLVEGTRHHCSACMQ